MSVYNILKLAHIFTAIIAIGFNLSYIVWLVRGKFEVSHLLYSLKGVKLMDDRIANPSYILSAISGLALAYVGGYNILNTGWIFYPIVLFILLGILGFGFYSPALSKLIRALEKYGSESPEYKKSDKKQTILGVILFTIALAIIAIMVLKPQLPVPFDSIN